MKFLQLGMYVNDVNMKKLENGQLCGEAQARLL
jgi:hypothetical protein